MNGFDGILFAVMLLAFLAGVFALIYNIYNGIRPLQPVPEHPTPPRKAVMASFVPVVCAAAH